MDIKLGIIGGSGLDTLLDRSDAKRHRPQTPFGLPSGDILETRINGVACLLLSRHGMGHLLPPSRVPYRANIFALKLLGCTHILATGAVGSLREEIRPRDLVLIDQTIDKTIHRESTFFDDAAVHVEMAEPMCPVLRQLLRDAAGDVAALAGDAYTAPGVEREPAVHGRGTYVAMEGPSFSTRAEALMHRIWGGDVIGMTAMPEARLAREAELPYALIALASDYDSWRIGPPPKPSDPNKIVTTAQAINKSVATQADLEEVRRQRSSLLAEIRSNLEAASSNAMALLEATIARIAVDATPLEQCPARDALSMAIWSDVSAIADDTKKSLAPLWGRYVR